MVIILRKWVAFVRFLLLFVLASMAIYRAMQLVDRWIEPIHRYDEPSGNGAMKVFGQAYTDPDRTPLERLKWFYWYGE